MKGPQARTCFTCIVYIYVLLSTHLQDCRDPLPPRLPPSLPAAPVCCSSRYGLALLSCYGLFVVYSLRVNLSVAMVDMLNSSHQSSPNQSSSLCPAHPSPTRPQRNNTVSPKLFTQDPTSDLDSLVQFEGCPKVFDLKCL